MTWEERGGGKETAHAEAEFPILQLQIEKKIYGSQTYRKNHNLPEEVFRLSDELFHVHGESLLATDKIFLFILTWSRLNPVIVLVAGSTWRSRRTKSRADCHATGDQCPGITLVSNITTLPGVSCKSRCDGAQPAVVTAYLLAIASVPPSTPVKHSRNIIQWMRHWGHGPFIW